MLKQTLIAGLVLAAGGAALLATGAEARGGPERPAFETLDADGDGKVTEAEFEAWRAAQFAARDLDGDGYLSAEEVAEAMRSGAGERAERMMARLDRDGDGRVAPEELGPREGRQGIVARLDADGDGAVSAEEFEAARERQAEMRKERGGRFGGRFGGHGPARN